HSMEPDHRWGQRRWWGWLWNVRGDQGRREALVEPPERLFHRQVGHKLIAVAPECPDHPLRVPTVAHVPPDTPETALQRRIRDGEACPDVVAQLLLGDETRAML